MYAVTPETRGSRSGPAARHAARVAECWPSVRVKEAQVTPCESGERARAVVYLGCLTPADVRVELTPARAGMADVAMPPGGHRLFSSQGYGNGCFVFDTTLRAGATARSSDWMLHVHPTEALEEPRVEYRLRS